MFGIPHNFLTVISSFNVDKPNEIYGFFRSINKSFKVNPVVNSSYKNTDKAFPVITPAEYGQFLCRLFDIWMNDEDSGIRIGTLDTYIKNTAARRPFNCQHSGDCFGKIIGIKPDGEITICSRFEDTPAGNILETPLVEILRGDMNQKFARRSAALESCRNCENFSICHGGCPNNALAFYGDPMKKDYFCLAYKLIYGRIREYLAQEKA
jgi:uncharacterized protein